jgi:hypothetical protein
MEAFKLAVETIIVGLLALPWLAVAIDLLAPTLDLARIVSFVAGEAKVQAAFGVALLALAYVLGSAVTPLAQEFVDDEHWYDVKLPTERSTKTQVYLSQATLGKRAQLPSEFKDPHDSTVQDHCQDLDNLLRNRNNDVQKLKDCFDTAQAVFLLEESVVEGQGSPAAEPERLTLLREQLIVLRGATFNLCVLLLVCTFGFIARLCTYLWERMPWQSSRVVVSALACIPPILVIAFAWHSARQDVHHPDVTDPPIMELVVGEIALLGLIIAIRGVRYRPYIAAWTVPAGFFVASLAYCGWIWTEVVYDQRVINSYMAATPTAHIP